MTGQISLTDSGHSAAPCSGVSCERWRKPESRHPPRCARVALVEWRRGKIGRCSPGDLSSGAMVGDCHDRSRSVEDDPAVSALVARVEVAAFRLELSGCAPPAEIFARRSFLVHPYDERNDAK